MTASAEIRDTEQASSNGTTGETMLGMLETAPINDASDLQCWITSAVEGETASMSEMARNLSGVNGGASEIVSGFSGVSRAAHETSARTSGVENAASELSQMATKLRMSVGASQS